MHYRLKSLSLATATLLLSLTSPLLPLTLKCEPLVVQAQTAQEQKLQADGLLGQGFNQLNDSQYQAAIQSLQEALKIYRQLGNRHKEATSLYGLGWAYDDLGQLGRAIESYQASLVIAREIGDRWLEATDLNLLGYAYLQLGQYRQALQFNQQSLVIARERGDPFKEALALADLGLVYFSLNEYERAIKFANQALTIADSRGFRLVQAYVLNDLGKVYRAMGQPQKAPKFHQQSITIAQNIGKRYWEAIAFNDLGIAYEAIGEYQQAMESYQQALTISHDIGFLAGEGKALSDIGSLLAQQNQPELAIVFYKQSVNAREAIRRNIQGLPWEARESYTKTVADTYRALADLLLKQDRVLEAQRVLDLLKVQELEDYLRNVRGNNNTAQGLPNLPPEEQTWTSYQAILNKAMEIGNGERITLRDIQTWSLKNVDLVVLSACETGLGGKLGNGEEILGLGYQMQRAGARAAIASLWTVDDGGTQVLMNAFYANLNKSDTTKAEALRQAQIALITGDSTALGKDRGLGVEERDRPLGGSEANRTDVLSQAANRLSHPYYWAPFILIGNGL